jgi:hypothetical protein
MTSNSNANDGAVATMSVSSPFKPTSSTLAVGGVTKAGGAINTITSSTTIFPNGNRRGPLDLQVRIDTSDNKLFNRKNTTSPKKQASSSTSSSSKPTMMILPIEDLLQDKSLDINERRLLIQMDFVQRARVLIKELKHPDLQKHLEKIDTTKQKRLHLALIKDQYLLNSINVLFNYECEEANSEFMMKCEKLRQEMLDEIQQEIDDIQEQRQLLFGTTTDIISTTTKNKQQNTTTRKTRSTRSKGDKDLLTGDLLGQLVNPMVFAYDTAQKIKKKAGYVFQPLEKRLAPSEIEHDVRELTAHLEATKKRRMETKGLFLFSTSKYMNIQQ